MGKTKNTIKRPVARIDTSGQLGLFAGERAEAQVEREAGRPRFVEPPPEAITLAGVALDEHLKRMGIKAPFVVRDLLGEVDWSEFEREYAASGRRAYAPRAMMGIVLYGLMQGVSSLRGLERLARTDLGCMWVSGGITPDYSVLGRFIHRHGEQLTGVFFTELTARVLKRTGTHAKMLAGDGTSVEAMSSRFALLSREALERRAADPARPLLKRAAAEQAAQRLEQRPNAKAIVPHEPEASLLKLKGGRGTRPAYVGSVLANEGRIVTAAQVHPSSEIAVIPALLDQAAAAGGAMAEELLLDAGYHCFELIDLTLAREISLLCPEQSEHRRGAAPKSFALSAFHYDPLTDTYRCPAAEIMRPVRRYRGPARRPYTQYATPACRSCALRTQCTASQRGRTVQRAQGQEAKDLLREQVMSHPQAKARFAKRKAMVEPVFAHLRGVQGLNRFRRRGLAGVRLEFTLHLLAYNLARAVAYALHFAARAEREALYWTCCALFWATMWRQIAGLRAHSASGG